MRTIETGGCCAGSSTQTTCYGDSGGEPSSIRSLVETVTALPGYTSSVGTRVLVAEPGRAHLLVLRGPDLVQFNGFFHGGVIAGLADHAAGGAVTTLLPEGRIAVTLDLSVNFLAPADGDSIVARAEAVQVGTTICVARVDVMTVDNRGERLCAICVATLRSVPMPALTPRPEQTSRPA